MPETPDGDPYRGIRNQDDREHEGRVLQVRIGRAQRWQGLLSAIPRTENPSQYPVLSIASRPESPGLLPSPRSNHRLRNQEDIEDATKQALIQRVCENQGEYRGEGHEVAARRCKARPPLVERRTLQTMR
jgi:hypothetical protein